MPLQWEYLKKERVFFIGHRKELNYPKLKLDFKEKAIPFAEYKETEETITHRASYLELWKRCKQGKSFSTVHPNGTYFGENKCSDTGVPNTIIANQSGSYLWHSTEPRPLNKSELCQTGTYPLDYDFQDIEPKYLIGMSVPPTMTAQISNKIKEQWLDTEKVK